MAIYNRSIQKEDLTQIFMSTIQPALNVEDKNIGIVIDDLLVYNERYSVPVDESTLGVMSGLSQYLNFASGLDGARFDPNMDSDIYKHGIKCIDKAVQAIMITENNPRIREEFGRMLSLEEDILSKPTDTTKPNLYLIN